MFDLLLASDRLRQHAAEGRIAFGINHVMVDHRNGRRKALDLVVCRPSVETPPSSQRRNRAVTFASQVETFGIELTAEERSLLDALPALHRKPVGTVLIALEAKAVMTEFAKARPRLYDELESSHTVVHGDTDSAIAMGLALINASDYFISPTKNPCVAWGAPQKPTRHDQPTQAKLTIEKIRALPRSEGVGSRGFDAIATAVLSCRNDGSSQVAILRDAAWGFPAGNDVLSYATLINRVVGIYGNRFSNA
jgi:hypothetical protein